MSLIDSQAEASLSLRNCNSFSTISVNKREPRLVLSLQTYLISLLRKTKCSSRTLWTELIKLRFTKLKQKELRLPQIKRTKKWVEEPRVIRSFVEILISFYFQEGKFVTVKELNTTLSIIASVMP